MMTFYINVTWSDGRRETVNQSSRAVTAIGIRDMYRKWFGAAADKIMVESQPVINTPMFPDDDFWGIDRPGL